MMRFPALLVSAFFIAALCVSASPSKSLYAAPAAASPAKGVQASDAVDEDAPAATPAMEDKFRKLQKEMESGPEQPKTVPKNTPPPHEGVAMGTLAMQILLGLAFVLLLAVLTIRGLKRMQGKLLSRAGKGGDLIEILETCHLGPQQKVIAIRFNDDVGILGVTKENISLLTMLKEPMDELRKARGGESNSAVFSDNLNKLLDRFKKPKKVSDLLDEAQG